MGDKDMSRDVVATYICSCGEPIPFYLVLGSISNQWYLLARHRGMALTSIYVKDASVADCARLFLNNVEREFGENAYSGWNGCSLEWKVAT